jgi:glutathione S-transferase
MSDYTLCYWPVPLRGQFIRAILAHAGKSWKETDTVSDLTSAEPDQQPIPFMGPPMLIVERTGFALAEMPAIALYLGETLGLLPESPEGRALSLKMVADANDLIDEITQQGGREIWTTETWDAFQSTRLKRWMKIWEVTGEKNGLEDKSGFLFGRKEAGIADIVTATLWSTLREKFPEVGKLLTAEAPRTAALAHRLWGTPALAQLAKDSDIKYGKDTYCGGQIGASLNKVAGGMA